LRLIKSNHLPVLEFHAHLLVLAALSLFCPLLAGMFIKYSNGIDLLSTVLWIINKSILLLVISYFKNSERTSGICLYCSKRFI